MLGWLRRPIRAEVRRKLAFLLESQYWSADRIQEFQWNKLQALLTHAYAEVPYYRRVFLDAGARPDDIASPADYARLPVLTKRALQVSLDQLVATRIDRKTLALNSTGGSTGMPISFYQDQGYLEWSDAARWRAWRYMVGADERSLEAVLWGAMRDIGKGVGIRRMLYSVLREGVVPLNTFDLDDGALRRYLKYYNLFAPPVLRGYASSLYYVARYVERNGIRIHKPRAVVSSTEVLHPRMRTAIERVFGCTVFDSYGCREVSQIASECEAHDGFHVVFENQYVELDGNDLLVTNLNNLAMPLLRYRVGDLAESLNRSPCSCGRSSLRIMKLMGRDNDNIELPNGKVINGEFFEFLFFGIPSVVQYQVVYQRSTDCLLMRLQVSDGSAAAEGALRKAMSEKFNYTNVAVEYTDAFDRTPTGKLRFVYSVE